MNNKQINFSARKQWNNQPGAPIQWQLMIFNLLKHTIYPITVNINTYNTCTLCPTAIDNHFHGFWFCSTVGWFLFEVMGKLSDPQCHHPHFLLNLSFLGDLSSLTIISTIASPDFHPNSINCAQEIHYSTGRQNKMINKPLAQSVNRPCNSRIAHINPKRQFPLIA